MRNIFQIKFIRKIQTSLTNSNSITSREGGLAVCINLYETFGYKMEQYSASLIPILIYLCMIKCVTFNLKQHDV